MISYHFVPISSQKVVLFFEIPGMFQNINRNIICGLFERSVS